MTVVSPGTNFATSMARAPWRAKTLPARRTQVSGSSDEATQPRQHACTAAPAQLVPTEVDAEGHHRDRAEHQRDTGSPVCGEGADGQESRQRGEGDADLLSDGQGGRITTPYCSRSLRLSAGLIPLPA